MTWFSIHSRVSMLIGWAMSWNVPSRRLRLGMAMNSPDAPSMILSPLITNAFSRVMLANPFNLLSSRNVILISVLVITLAVVGGMWWNLVSTRDALKDTERVKRAERDELQPYIERVEVLEAKRASLKHKIDVINGLKDSQKGPVRIMDEVSKALPELVWLTEMKLAGNNLTLLGLAMDENAVANYISNLDASDYFEEPVLSDMSRQPGKDVFKFDLTVVFTHNPQKIEGAEAGAEAGAGA